LVDDADIIRVVAAVIERDGRYLVARRPEGKRHSGLWEFPGGKVEPGESDAEATRRELREELGVEVQAIGDELAQWHDPNSPFHIIFLSVQISDEPQCIEHMALAWLAPEDLVACRLAPSDRRFVRDRWPQ
jgi:mutator protein MutT